MTNSELPANMDVKEAKNKLKIAIIYSRIPFPMMRGDQLTVSHLIQYLNLRGHEITLYTNDLDGELSEVQDKWLHNSCEEVNIYPVGKLGRLVNIAKGLIKQWPLQIGYLFSNHLAADARRDIKKGKFDVVYTYYLRSAPVTNNLFSNGHISSFNGKKCVSFLAMQLSQTLNTVRIYENENSIIKKAIYFLEWRLLRRYESRIWKSFNKSMLIGPKDVEAVKQSCLDEGQPEINNWLYGAHGTDVRKFKAAEHTDVVGGRIVFSGSMLYQPNVQAVHWFIDNCWDNIRKEFPKAELYIVGRDPVASILKVNGKKKIIVTGTVPDVGEYIRTANVCINPMLSAGGMQNKLIEYMACAKAIVATTIANEGIGGIHNESLLIADDAKTFSQTVSDILNGNINSRLLGSNARSFVLSNWTWEAHFKKLETDFINTLNPTHENTIVSEVKEKAV